MSERLKIAVCDDETRALAIVSSAIGGIFTDMGVDIALETFQGAAPLLERMKVWSFDLMFLDISMPKMDGIRLGKAMQAMGCTADIVFVSSRTDRIFDTFAVEPFGFVRKGHFMEDLNEVITRFAVKQKKSKNEDVVCFKDGQGIVSVNISQIKYIECVRNTQVLFFDDGVTQRKIYSRMETLTEELKKYGFIRVHKGYLVNCWFVSCFDSKGLMLTTGDQISVGRNYYQSARMEYLGYISRSGAAFIGKTGLPFQE